MAPQRLGQHFLADAGWRRRIAGALFGAAGAENDSAAAGGSAAAAKLHGVWIEIGAGHGEMTELLAAAAERVVAIELDSRLLPELGARFAAQPNVTVVAGDVLALDLAQLAGVPQFSVYGSLPYYITSPIVHRILASGTAAAGTPASGSAASGTAASGTTECGAALREALLVMQMEVAERLAAPAGSRERGYFSAFTQFYATPEILLRIPPGAFRPPPKVQSALVRLRPPGARPRLGVADEAGFVGFLKACFAQKRKTLRNNLRNELCSKTEPTRADELLRQAGVAPNARAEQLSLDELARLFAAVRGESATGAQRSGRNSPRKGRQ